MGSKTKVKKAKPEKAKKETTKKAKKKLKHVIITGCNAKFGDFLADNWFASLKANVDLSNVDVVILDYNLTDEQRKRLKGAKLIRCKEDGHIVMIRFRDMYNLLKSNKYDQVISTDGGDIIFQTDLKDVFEKNKDTFRAVPEMISMPYNQMDSFLNVFFKKQDAKTIKKILKGTRTLNAGVLVGPADKFRDLCKEVFDMVTKKDRYGPDQVAVNYILYRDGFKELEEKYNFVVIATKHNFKVKNSVFYLMNGEKISIIHNGAGKEALRPIKNFGYGPGHNKPKRLSLALQRDFVGIMDGLFNKKRS